MTIDSWLELLGRSSEDQKLLAALKQAKAKVPAMAKHCITASVVLTDVMLVFTDGGVFPDLVDGGDGVTVLSSVELPLKNQKWGQYEGPLPYDLKQTDSRKQLRARFGKPSESNKTFRWDEWKIDQRMVRATYTEKLDELESLGVSLPEP